MIRVQLECNFAVEFTKALRILGMVTVAALTPTKMTMSGNNTDSERTRFDIYTQKS